MTQTNDSGSHGGAAANQPLTSSSSVESSEARVELLQDRSFWGLMVTQFLGAFNDNLYKQLMLLLALPAALSAGVQVIQLGENQPATAQVSSDVPTEGAVVDEAAASDNASATEQSLRRSNDDVQGWAGLVFALPFVLFSGFAGFLADRFKKTPIIVLCKYAEILVMGLGMLAFWYYSQLGEVGTWTVLFLMGMQSAFFGPSKYGILPELFHYKDLARANGLILMSTFLAIIMGIVAAGVLKQYLTLSQLWVGSMVCLGIAVLGTITSHMIRHTPIANPTVRLTADCWGVSKDMLALFKKDKPLLMAIFVSSVFWLVSGLAVPVVNRLGMEQLGVGETKTSILTACIAVGIMLGAVMASYLCRSKWSKYVVNLGLGGIFVMLLLLGMWQGSQQIMGFSGSLLCLMVLGIFAAIFSIPVQVFLQSRPPKELKGRLIATMNQANFLGILLAGPLYQLFEKLSSGLGWPISSVFWMMGALMLPLAIFYRLDSRVPDVDDVAGVL